MCNEIAIERYEQIKELCIEIFWCQIAIASVLKCLDVTAKYSHARAYYDPCVTPKDLLYTNFTVLP